MHNIYQYDLTTYEQVNDQLRPLPAQGNTVTLSDDKTTIVKYIGEASQMITNWCNRSFVPYINTSADVLYCLSPYGVQELPDDTLSVTSITDTGGTAITLYELRDIYNELSGYPYRYFQISNQQSYSVTDSNGYSPRWTVNGIFGYSKQSYANTWVNTTTLNDASVTDSVTSITVSSAANIETLDYIRVETEFMQVTDTATNTLTVIRGVNGSTAASHADTTQVDVWRIDPAIKLAATRLASYLYSSRQQEFQSVQFQDGTIASVNYPQIVLASIRDYVRRG